MTSLNIQEAVDKISEAMAATTSGINSFTVRILSKTISTPSEDTIEIGDNYINFFGGYNFDGEISNPLTVPPRIKTIKFFIGNYDINDSYRGERQSIEEPIENPSFFNVTNLDKLFLNVKAYLYFYIGGELNLFNIHSFRETFSGISGFELNREFGGKIITSNLPIDCTKMFAGSSFENKRVSSISFNKISSAERMFENSSGVLPVIVSDFSECDNFVNMYSGSSFDDFQMQYFMLYNTSFGNKEKEFKFKNYSNCSYMFANTELSFFDGSYLRFGKYMDVTGMFYGSNLKGIYIPESVKFTKFDNIFGNCNIELGSYNFNPKKRSLFEAARDLIKGINVKLLLSVYERVNPYLVTRFTYERINTMYKKMLRK